MSIKSEIASESGIRADVVLNPSPLLQVKKTDIADDGDFEREWKICSIAQFVKVFQEPLKLPEIEIEDLEEGLLKKSMYGIHLVKNLVVALLKNICRGVSIENYELFLQKIVAKIWIKEERKEENPLTENIKFEDIATLSKLDIIYTLCLYGLDKARDPNSKLKDKTKEMDGDSLRVRPLGCDNEGNEYWYFFGTRLYKQEPAKEKKIKNWEEEWNTQKTTSLAKRGRGRPRKISTIVKPRKSDGESDESEEVLNSRSRCTELGEKSRWSIVCKTLDDWVEFAEKFKDSKSKCEKTLFRTITDDFLPVMNEAYQAKEKKLQQKIRELIPKPTFTRMETRRKRTKSASDSQETDDKHKKNSSISRAHRLEERNRRLNESAEIGSKRRSRSQISYDENYDDSDEEPSKRRKKRLSFLENDEDFDEALGIKSGNRELAGAKANEILKEYASLVSNSSNNKSQILRVFTQVKLDKCSYPFHYAVDKEEFPEYHNIISNPMDLSRIERKLRLNIYKTAAEVDDDFKVMVENCELFFGVDSERAKMGRETWRLFRRLMKELPVPGKKNENSSVLNGSSASENSFVYKEKRATNVGFEKSERSKKKRKQINSEALDLLSKETVLAVERSHSMDEEHFRNFTQNSKKFIQFSDLIVEPIHSHPSDLIEKFMSESSNTSKEDSNSEDFPPTDNQNSASSDVPYDHQRFPENIGMNDYHESNEESSNPAQFFDKNDPKGFNILSSDNEANLEILTDNEVESHSVSNSLSTDSTDNSFSDPKCSDDDLNNVQGLSDKPGSNNIASNFVGESANLDSSLSNNSFESYHSSNSSSPDSNSKLAANNSPQPIESNATYLNEYASFTHESECNGPSTVDASCLGLASSGIYKRSQLEKEPKTSFAPNVSQGTLNYNGNQISYSSFVKLDSRNQPKTRVSNSDNQMMQNQIPHLGISKDKAVSTPEASEAMQTSLESYRRPPEYSCSSHQFVQGEIENQSSKTLFRPSGLSPEQEIQHKKQYLEQPGKHSRHSPTFLPAEIVQEGNIERQPNCSPVFRTSPEMGLDHSRSHSSCSPSDDFTLLEGQRIEDQESANNDVQHFASQHEVESQDSAKNHQRSSPVISFSQISGHHQTRSPTYSIHQQMQTPLSVNQEHNTVQSRHLATQEMQVAETVRSKYYTQDSSFSPAALKSHDSDERQHMPSLINPSHNETEKLKPVKGQVKNSSISYQNKQASNQMRFDSHQEVENRENNKSHPTVSNASYADQHLENQNSSMYWDQNFAGSLPRYSPTMSRHQEINNQPQVKPQPRYSPTLSMNQEMNRQQPAENLPSYSSSLPAYQDMNNQQQAKAQPRYSPALSLLQEISNQQAKNLPNYSSSLSAQQGMHCQQPAGNQPGCSPNASANQTDVKKSAKIQGIASFATSQVMEEQNAVKIQSNYLPDFSNQGVLAQESTKNLSHHISFMQNQVPAEAPPFDFGNIFSNTIRPSNATEPPFSANSTMQIPSQTSTSHFNPNHVPKPNFPAMKVRLPPSTGELIVVPGDPSSMTFHLLAKPLSDPSHPIQSSVEIHANNQMNNQVYRENANNESSSVRSKNPAKQNTATVHRKQTSPINDLQQLALNPRRSSTSPSTQKNKNCDNISYSSRSAEPCLKSPPAIANDSSVIKPNAVLVRPLESSTTSMQQQSRNNNSFQQDAFVQQVEGPRTVIFSKGNRMTNGSSISSNPVSAMPLNVNAQRPIIPSTLPNTVMQNGNGQFMFVPSKDIFQMDQNLKVKNSSFYAPSNMIPTYPFQNGQMNSVQMLPQLHLPYVNPYYIVTNPSAFQNVSRYPVMNMQPIPFQNR